MRAVLQRKRRLYSNNDFRRVGSAFTTWPFGNDGPLIIDGLGVLGPTQVTLAPGTTKDYSSVLIINGGILQASTGDGVIIVGVSGDITLTTGGSIRGRNGQNVTGAFSLSDPLSNSLSYSTTQRAGGGGGTGSDAPGPNGGSQSNGNGGGGGDDIGANVGGNGSASSGGNGATGVNGEPGGAGAAIYGNNGADGIGNEDGAGGGGGGSRGHSGQGIEIYVRGNYLDGDGTGFISVAGQNGGNGGAGAFHEPDGGFGGSGGGGGGGDGGKIIWYYATGSTFPVDARFIVTKGLGGSGAISGTNGVDGSFSKIAV